MLARLGRALLGGVLGYVAAALLAYAFVSTLSSSVHDRALEAVMTAAFVVGPAGALVGFLVGFFRRGG